jgi:hypothetical protein
MKTSKTTSAERADLYQAGSNGMRGSVAQRDKARTQAARRAASGTALSGRNPSRVSDTPSMAAQT